MTETQKAYCRFLRLMVWTAFFCVVVLNLTIPYHGSIVL